MSVCEQLHIEQLSVPLQCSRINNSDFVIKLSSISVSVHHVPALRSPAEYHWLVVKVERTNDSRLSTFGRELSVLLWVGLATRLPGHVPLHNNCKATIHLQLMIATE